MAPVEREDARVLILGSFPSIVSLERREYYANPRNQFWRIMGQLFEFETSLPYSVRCQKLLEHRIALWDVCESAQRTGSLDAAIEPESVVPNDLARFLQEHPRIELVAMNGQTAAGILDRLRFGHPLLGVRQLLRRRVRRIRRYRWGRRSPHGRSFAICATPQESRPPRATRAGEACAGDQNRPSTCQSSGLIARPTRKRLVSH